MPFTLHRNRRCLPKGTEKAATLAGLREAMLKWHGLTGIAAITPDVVDPSTCCPREHLRGPTATSVVFIEWKVPSFALANRAIQRRIHRGGDQHRA